MQTRRDICRAEFLVALAQGLGRDESAQALRYRAAAAGLSLHAAALAVLTAEPIDEVSVVRSSQPAQSPRGKHLHACRSSAALGATAVHGDASTMQRGRRHRG